MRDSPFTRRFGLALITASVPLVVTLLILTLQGYNWGNHAPTLGDEINYWHQAGTWAEAGLNGGYYVIDNATARVPFAHFFAWGFGPPVFYGTFAQFLGWPLNGVLNVNAVFFFLSVAVFVILARLDVRRCVLLAILLSVYPAILVYLPTSMLEPVYLACALVLAGGLYRMQQGERDWWVIGLTGLTLVFMSIMRFTWAIMFWPYLYYLAPWRFWTMRSRASTTAASQAESTLGTAEKKHLVGRDIASPFPGERRWLWSMIGTGVISGAFFLFYNWTTSPYLYALSIIVSMIPTEPDKAYLYYINGVAENVTQFLFTPHLPSITLRFVTVGLLIWSVMQRRAARTRMRREAITLILYILFSTFMLGIFAYSTVLSVGFRFFAPPVLMCLALMIAWDGQSAVGHTEASPRETRAASSLFSRVKQIGVLRIIVLIFVATVPLVFAGLDTMRDHAFAPGRADRIATYREQLHTLGITYTPDINPWCNTLAHSIRYLGDLGDQDRFLAVDAGMGISVIWWKPDEPQRARYIMLDEDYYEHYPDKTQLTFMADLPGGAIYRNEAVVCP